VAKEQPGRFTNLLLLLSLLAARALHSFLSATGDSAQDIGAFIGNVLGSILFAASVYFVVWLIRGRNHNPNGNRLVLKIALALAVLTTLIAAIAKFQRPAPSATSR
jgi:hypothetical protein